MNFCANKTSTEVIKKEVFGGAYFRYVYFSVNGRWYRKLWKAFNELKKMSIVSIIAQITTC